MNDERRSTDGETLSEAIANPHERVEIEVDAPARTWHLVIGSVEFWALVGGVSAVITAMTAVAAVIVGLRQLQDDRALQVMNSTYVSWNQLTEETLANPQFACPDTDAKFAKLMTTVDPRSPVGDTYRPAYTAYGYQLITTDEQILRMAPDDPHWRFLIIEQMRCQAPAIRYLMAQGTYERRYSCRLRRVISEAVGGPAPVCPAGEG